MAREMVLMILRALTHAFDKHLHLYYVLEDPHGVWGEQRDLSMRCRGQARGLGR